MNSLPREFDQGSQGQRPMVNRALRIYDSGRRAVAATCCVEHCGNAATHGAWCEACFEEYTALNEIWAREQLKKTDPAHLARVAQRWRFVNGFAFFFSLELLIGYCIETPRIWQSFALCVGAAMLVAGINTIFGGGAKKAGGQ